MSLQHSCILNLQLAAHKLMRILSSKNERIEFSPLCSGGVQPPSGEPRLNGGWGHQCAPSAGQSGDGEVPSEQRALQQPEEGQSNNRVDTSLLTVYHQAVYHTFVCVFQICCCCRVRFPLFSWPSTCLLCKRLEDKRPHVSWNVWYFKMLQGGYFVAQTQTQVALSS